MEHFALLVICAAAIYVSCEWFVNAVEWLGERLNIGKMAVGTVLAAIGTALPESVVTLIAVTTGKTPEARDIGVGAAMGGPLALATVAYGVTGFVLLSHRRALRKQVATARIATPVGASTSTAGTTAAPGSAAPGAAVADHSDPVVDVAGALPASAPALADEHERHRLAKDQMWFLPIFLVKVGLGLVAFSFKPALGLVFFAAYAVYFWREIRNEEEGGAEVEEMLEPLKFQPRAEQPATWAVVAQTLVTLIVIFFASQFFVHQLDSIGPMIGLSSSVTALLLSPIATELPETMNAIIWVRQGKTKLALANISGAMMIQATVPSGLGILFTSWKFDNALLWSGLVTMAAILYLLWSMRVGKFTATRLALAGGFYVVFALGLIPILN